MTQFVNTTSVVVVCCISLSYCESTTSFPLYSTLYDYSGHLPSQSVALFFSSSSVTQQSKVNSSNLSLKGPQQSKAYRVITAPMNLCAPLALIDGERQSGKDSSFLSNGNTAQSSEMHGLPQSTTAPLLSQEFAGTRRLHAPCGHSHSNPINLRRGVISTQRDLQWPSPRPRTVIDLFTFQEQFHRK